jgi:hypothetical protein
MQNLICAYLRHLREYFLPLIGQIFAEENAGSILHRSARSAVIFPPVDNANFRKKMENLICAYLRHLREYFFFKLSCGKYSPNIKKANLQNKSSSTKKI